MRAAALDSFHPLVRTWFQGRFGSPTDAQAQAWPLIGRGENVLVCAPTGSGKTLTAFLSAIDNLICGRWAPGRLRALYLSPLKALGSDVRRNLLGPLAELRALFEQHGQPFPPLRVMTRSGDTPDEERRQIVRHPPEILITTPESLNLMLTGKLSRQIFDGLKAVILDEIHALAQSKRGTYMMAAVERLTLSAGEVQRIALSATVRPAEAIARWMGGYAADSHGKDTVYRPRPVTVVNAADKRDLVLTLRTPDVEWVGGPDAKERWWQALAGDLRSIVEKNRSTLLFANSRRSVEKVARFLNADRQEPIAYSHHGSLSREIRLDVEERMKAGQLRAVVATGSLELGIDIGSVEEVVLIGAPPSVAQAVQRIGRADHRVGGVSRAHLFVMHGLDGVEAASMEGLVRRGAIEETRPIRNPLDVLGQVLLSMGSGTSWDLDELYAFVRTIAAYHELPRAHFDLVLAMLAGRYADSPVRELRPRAVLDRVKNTFTARKGTELVLYQSGGTIPDRGYYHLRLADSKAVIGELDEEFVWERRLGDQFSLGTQAWRIHAITHNDVEVGPADPNGPMIPFWKAEPQNRSTEASFALLDFLDWCEENIDRPELAEELAKRHAMDAASARRLAELLARQRLVSGVPLPGRRRVIVECTKDPSAPEETQRVILHTFWGGRVNRPLAIALAEAWLTSQQTTLDCYATNDHVLLSLPSGFDPTALFAWVTSTSLDAIFRAGLEKTPLFGSRFRENAGRALLLPRGDAKRRYPLWLNRLRSKKLLAQVSRYPDFPIVLETWRDLLEDEFELPTLAALLDDVATGRIAIHTTRPAHPTPFTEGIVFTQTNYHMYLDDTPVGEARSSLADELVRDLFQGASPLPAVPAALAHDFESKLLRSHPDYRPTTEEEVLLAVREMVLVPRTVVDAWLAGPSEGSTQQAASAPSSLVSYRLPGARSALVSDLSDLPRILFLRGVTDVALEPLAPGADDCAGYLRSHPFTSDSEAAATLVGEHLRSLGPTSADELAATLGFAPDELRTLLDELIETESIVAGQLVVERDERLFCDAENAERLLRIHRAARRAATEQSLRARPFADLQQFLADWHGLGRDDTGIEALQNALDRLFGFPAAAELWEEAILPARLSTYYPSWLDTLFQSYGLGWLGCGNKKVSFALPGDVPLFRSDEPPAPTTDLQAALLQSLAEGDGRPLFDLTETVHADTGRVTEALWELAWQGRASSDSYEAVRRGIASDFSVEAAAEAPGRTGFRRWKLARPSTGKWLALPAGGPRTAVETAELDKERARQALARYGVVFRELLEHELPPLRWSKLFRAFRLLELSGEIASGRFFDGLSGIQFATHEALRRLRAPWPSDRLYFINACDPASLCGVGAADLPGGLPRRLPGNWMVLCGSRLVMTLQRTGRELTILVEPTDPVLQPALGIYRFLLGREGIQLSSMGLESVNGGSPLSSPYAEELRRFGFASDYRGMTLWKR